jgi:hypothetical protein
MTNAIIAALSPGATGERLLKLNAAMGRAVRCDQFGVSFLNASIGTGLFLTMDPSWKLSKKGEPANLFSQGSLSVGAD